MFNKDSKTTKTIKSILPALRTVVSQKMLLEAGQRVLIVETSGLPEFERTRKFYDKCNYERAAVIRDFYQDGEDKVVFWKKLSGSNPSQSTVLRQ